MPKSKHRKAHKAKSTNRSRQTLETRLKKRKDDQKRMDAFIEQLNKQIEESKLKKQNEEE